MKKFCSWMLVAACTVAIAAPALADKPKKSRDEIFKKMDKDSDGKLTFEEFKGKRKEDKAKKAFDRMDVNGDAALTLEEFKAGPKKKK